MIAIVFRGVKLIFKNFVCIRENLNHDLVRQTYYFLSGKRLFSLLHTKRVGTACAFHIDVSVLNHKNIRSAVKLVLRINRERIGADALAVYRYGKVAAGLSCRFYYKIGRHAYGYEDENQ